MSISPAGALVCLALIILGYCLRAPVVVGLLGSLAFGSTAILTLDSLGGSSPLIYTCFVAGLLLSVVLRGDLWRDLGAIFAGYWMTWVICALGAYSVAGAYILPRLFSGQTSAFVPSRTRGGVFEVPLEPTSANVSQTGYLILGILTFLAFCVLLDRQSDFRRVRAAFFTWCTLHVTLGMLDLIGKLVGVGDVLAPIRTASYAMLTQAELAGFSRLVGAYSEASAFGGVTLACLAFTMTFWVRTKSLGSFFLTLMLVILLALSTSTTAYVGACIVSIPLAWSVLRSLLAGECRSVELVLLALVPMVLICVLAINILNPTLFDPLKELLQTTIIDKSVSESGQERAYWNQKSLQSFFDTGGLGIGVGSSRASSWVIAVLSQLGVVGAALIGVLVCALLWGAGQRWQIPNDADHAFVASVRACALTGLVSGSMISGSADPGIIFFIALAVISVYRVQSSRTDLPEFERLETKPA